MARPVLAIDLGGTKILAALVDGATVLRRAECTTDRSAGPDVWLNQMAQLVHDWPADWPVIGITVTGLIHNGTWSALSRGTLNLADSFPLANRAQALFGRPVALANDAQAAAWGEYRHGAGAGRDMVFLTVSTGIGGGIIAGGRLLAGRSGMAGHVGLLQPMPDGDGIFEDAASGRFIAQTSGRPSARDAFTDDSDAANWSISASARRVARLCRNLQLLTDPQVIVIGGGVGLAPGYLDRVSAQLADLEHLFKPTLARAALGTEAGVIGIAALAQETP